MDAKLGMLHPVLSEGEKTSLLAHVENEDQGQTAQMCSLTFIFIFTNLLKMISYKTVRAKSKPYKEH